MRRSKMVEDSDKGKYASPEGSPTWEYVATTSCSLLIFCVGCVLGWTSPTLGILMGPDTPIPLTPSDASTLSAMIALGHALAPTFTVVMADKLGRKNSLLAIGIPTVLSWGLIAFTNEITVLIVARFIAGLSVGLILCIPPMYLGEIASVKMRGAIGMVCGTMTNAGLLFMYAVVPWISIQTMASICLSIATVSMITISIIPESPYYLAMVGRFDEAEGALEKLRGKTDVTEELDLIKMTVMQRVEAAEEGQKNEREVPKQISALKKLFTVAGNRKALYINFLFAVALQLGSYIITMIYGQIIINKMKTGVSAHLCTIVIASLQLVCNVSIVFVIDKLGRKPLICVSGVISGVCVLVIGLYFYLMDYTEIDATPYRMFALFAVFGNIVALNIGLMPLQLVVQSEIISNDVKALTTCFIGVGGGVIGTVAIKLYLMVAETWGFGHSVPFLVFAANTWVITGLILRSLPETKGKTLLEIQRDLNA